MSSHKKQEAKVQQKEKEKRNERPTPWTHSPHGQNSRSVVFWEKHGQAILYRKDLKKKARSACQQALCSALDLAFHIVHWQVLDRFLTRFPSLKLYG